MHSRGRHRGKASPDLGLAVYFLLSGLSSVLLLLVNKTLSGSFPFPLVTVCLQNVCALGCTFSYAGVTSGFIREFHYRHMGPSLPGTFMFVVALWLNKAALGYTSLPVFVVANNLRPMATALIEYVLVGFSVTRTRLTGLVCIAVGAAVTAKSVGERELRGLGIAAVCTLVVSLLNVVDGKFMRSVMHEQTPAGINLYRLLVSVPVFLLMFPFSTETNVSSADFDSVSTLLLLMSGVTCTFAGVSLFELQARTSATSIQVANVAFKVVTTILSLFTHGEFPTLAGWAGYAISTAGVILYSAETLVPKTRLKKV